MRAVAYARVSSDQQVEGYGIDAQIAAARAWCRAHGVRLVAIAIDEGISGAADPADRHGLVDAIAHIRSKRADVLVVYRLDRLARDLVMQEQLLAEVHRAGGRVHSTSPSEDGVLEDDPGDPTRALIRMVLGAVAQYERSMIRLRTAAGKARKGDMGGYTGGRPPYGWRAREGELEPSPPEQAVVKRIRRLYHDGLSIRAIAAELNADGIGRADRGGQWQFEQVRRVLIRAGDLVPSSTTHKRSSPGSLPPPAPGV